MESFMETVPQVRIPADIGRRIVQAASLAMALHCEAMWKSNMGRQPKTGRAVGKASAAESGAVTDDLPAGQAAQPQPRTLAGDDPAGSFFEH